MSKKGMSGPVPHALRTFKDAYAEHRVGNTRQLATLAIIERNYRSTRYCNMVTYALLDSISLNKAEKTYVNSN